MRRRQARRLSYCGKPQTSYALYECSARQFCHGFLCLLPNESGAEDYRVDLITSIGIQSLIVAVLTPGGD